MDTSCLIAAFCQWHEHNTATLAEVTRRIDQGSTLAIAAHSLLETYSVLTRLPAPRRLPSDQALALIQANLAHHKILAIEPRDYWKLLQTCSDKGWTGGVVYDALVAALAESHGIPEILTHNQRDFARLVGSTTRIVVPA